MLSRFPNVLVFLFLIARASAWSSSSNNGGQNKQQKQSFGDFEFGLANSHVNTGNEAFAAYLHHHHRVFVSTPSFPTQKNHVEDCMRALHRTPTVFLDDPVDDALAVMLANSHDISSVAVVDRETHELRGVLHPWDVLHRAADAGTVLPLDDAEDTVRNMVSAVRPMVAKTVEDLLPNVDDTSSPISITPKTTIKTAAALLQNNHLQYLPVVDEVERTRLVGSLSAVDVLKSLLPPLPRSVQPPLPDTEHLSLQMFKIIGKNNGRNTTPTDQKTK